MVWAKIHQNRVVGTCRNCPPMSEAGAIEPDWYERSDNDPAVQTYYQEQINPAATQPDMLNFRLDMLNNSGYLRVTAAAAVSQSGMLTVSRLESALLFEKPHWTTIQTLWGQILGNLSFLTKPTAAEITSWNAIVTARRITAISFASNGAIVLK